VRTCERLRVKLRILTGRRLVEHGMDAELHFHIQQQIDENLPPA
jgi:hypothetical protein